MSYLPLLLSLFVVDLLAAISPGPNFVLVTQAAIHRSRRHAAAVVGGFALSNLIWCSAVALGLSSLFRVVPWLYGGIKLLGGAYLVYLGVSLWRSAGRADESEAPAAGGSQRSAFARGVLTNLSNPKSAVYFGSIFALFLKPGTPAWVQVAAVAIVLANTLLWYGTVAALFSSAAVQRAYAAIRRPLDRAAGALMIAFGARLILARDELAG